MSMRAAINLILCGLAAGWMLWACRRIQRRDPVVGVLVQIGLALRLWGGLLLFGISYLKLPILQRLYLGDGFWELAPDARGYFWAGTMAAEEGLHTVADWSASPAFSKTLGLWMRAVGVSPASAVLLNAVSYLGIAALLVAVFRRDQSRNARTGLVLSLTAFTCSPAFLLFGTQALKDQFFSLLLVASCGAAWFGFRALRASAGSSAIAGGALAAVGAALLTYLMAGIRPYVAFLLVLGVATILAVRLWGRPARSALLLLVAGVLTVCMLWMSFKAGAGAYYGYYESSLLGAVGLTPRAADAGGVILTAREGFVKAGGATNVVPKIRRHEGAGVLLRTWEQIAQLVLGITVLLLPISVLKALSIVEFAGGRGLLLVTDLDTLFIDATILAVVLFLKRTWRPPRPNVEYVAFTAGLGVVTAGLMAFVVTNYGSLFRLRLIVAALAWMLPLAVIRQDPGRSAALEPGAEGTARAGRA